MPADRRRAPAIAVAAATMVTEEMRCRQRVEVVPQRLIADVLGRG